MKLDVKAISLASAILYGAIFVLCALVVWLWPLESTKFASWWAHIDLTNLTRKVTMGSFLGGIVFTTIAGYVSGWVFAKIYNKLVK